MRRLVVAIPLVVVALAATACGDDDSRPSGGPQGAPSVEQRLMDACGGAANVKDWNVRAANSYRSRDDRYVFRCSDGTYAVIDTAPE